MGGTVIELEAMLQKLVLALTVLVKAMPAGGGTKTLALLEVACTIIPLPLSGIVIVALVLTVCVI